MATSKINLARQLNWDKARLTMCEQIADQLMAHNKSPDDHLKVQEAQRILRSTLQQLAIRGEVKGDYTVNLPFVETRWYKRAMKSNT